MSSRWTGGKVPARHIWHSRPRGELADVARADRDRTTARVELGLRVTDAIWNENLHTIWAELDRDEMDRRRPPHRRPLHHRYVEPGHCIHCRQRLDIDDGTYVHADSRRDVCNPGDLVSRPLGNVTYYASPLVAGELG